MDRGWLSIAALPAMLIVVPAFASDLPAISFDRAVAPVAAVSPLSWVAPVSAQASEAPVPAIAAEREASVASLTTLAAWNGGTLESIRYRPRRGRQRERERDRDYHSSSSSASGFSQIHGGFFDPDGDPPSAILFGVRAGANLDDNFQLGLSLDWSHRSDRTSTVVTEVPLPGGGTAEQQRVLAQSSSNLVPMMGFLQVSPGHDLPISPYFGVGGGYEVLFLDAEDFATGDSFTATYGGWGWQVWGGATAQLSGSTRLAGEVFWNEADLERDVDDSAGGTLREVIPENGLGMRFGLSWGF